MTMAQRSEFSWCAQSFTIRSNLHSWPQNGRAPFRSRGIPPQPGGRSLGLAPLAGGERSETPHRIGMTIRIPAWVAGAPRAPAGAHSLIAILRPESHALRFFGCKIGLLYYEG